MLADCDKIYAMSGGFSTEGSSDLQELFEERLRRPMGPPNSSRFGAGHRGTCCRATTILRFHVEAEIVIHGTTHPDAQVALQGEPLKLRPDGTFSVRLDLPNRRQVIPIVASTKDGVEQRTIVLAVERNTKVMEPLTRDQRRMRPVLAGSLAKRRTQELSAATEFASDSRHKRCVWQSSWLLPVLRTY